VQALRTAGAGDAELHGYTHLHPDLEAWVRAPDRYANLDWYRELGRGAAAAIAARPREEHPLALGLDAHRRRLGTRPTTLICPGDEWTNEVIEEAARLGFDLVSCYHLALRHGDSLFWTPHVHAPPLDAAAGDWLASGLPAVACFHDRDLVVRGTHWLGECLDAWAAAEARRLIDFRELAALLACRVELAADGPGAPTLTVESGYPPPVRAVPVRVRSEDVADDPVYVAVDGREGTWIRPTPTPNQTSLLVEVGVGSFVECRATPRSARSSQSA
jgi:hypothetical protein